MTVRRAMTWVAGVGSPVAAVVAVVLATQGAQLDALTCALSSVAMGLSWDSLR